MSRRTFVVTGGTQGIGLATVRRLTTAGHHTIAMARSAPAQPIPGEFVAVDLADPDATEQAIRDVLQQQPVDGVVNNVGLVNPASLGSVTYDQLFDVMNVNLRSALQLTQAILLE